MIYTIVGTPDTGKVTVANNLRSFLNEGECDNCFQIAPDVEKGEDQGFLADYRSEVLWAAGRACNPGGKKQNIIFTHSLLDSLAYVGLHVKDLLEQDLSNPDVLRWSTAFNIILQMLVDSTPPDHILYIPYKGEEQNHIDLDDALQDVLDSLELDYTEIDPTGEASTWTTT